MKLLIIGYGKMGRLVDELATGEAVEVTGRIDVDNVHGDWPAADVAIDFSIAAAVPGNLRRLAASGTNLVVGTTGWDASETALRAAAEEAGIGVVASANFSIGVNLLQAMVAEAARLMAAQPDYGAWIHEAHHSAKVDAPSGTAISLERAAREAGYDAPIDVSSTRAGSMPGTHTVGFDGPFDTITLTHTARSRSTFARGALEAARWVSGRQGWFTMRDVLGLDP